MTRAERHQRMAAYGLCSLAAARFLDLGSGASRWLLLTLGAAVFGLWGSAYIAVKREANRP